MNKGCSFQDRLEDKMHGFLKSKMNKTSAQKSHHKNYSFVFNRSLVQFLLQNESRLKSPLLYFECSLVLKPQNITEPLLKNMQDNDDSVEHWSVASS